MPTDPFLVQLAELCCRHPAATKWVFVPSHAVGHTQTERLALEGTNWANLRCLPPVDLALQMAAPFLVERNIDPAPQGQPGQPFDAWGPSSMPACAYPGRPPGKGGLRAGDALARGRGAQGRPGQPWRIAYPSFTRIWPCGVALF